MGEIRIGDRVRVRDGHALGAAPPFGVMGVVVFERTTAVTIVSVDGRSWVVDHTELEVMPRDAFVAPWERPSNALREQIAELRRIRREVEVARTRPLVDTASPSPAERYDHGRSMRERLHASAPRREAAVQEVQRALKAWETDRDRAAVGAEPPLCAPGVEERAMDALRALALVCGLGAVGWAGSKVVTALVGGG